MRIAARVVKKQEVMTSSPDRPEPRRVQDRRPEKTAKPAKARPIM